MLVYMCVTMYVQVGIFVDNRGCCLLYFLVTLYLRFWFRFGCVTESLAECRAIRLDWQVSKPQ